MGLAFTEEDVEVRLHVKLSAIITLGLYGGPITKEIVAQNVDALLAQAGGVASFIDDVELMAVELDEGTNLLPAVFPDPKEPT